MSDGWREIGRMNHAIEIGGGRAVRSLIVGVDNGTVTIGAVPEPFWRLRADERQDFQMLFMEAERQAEAWATEHGEAS